MLKPIKRWIRRTFLFLLLILALGFFIPETIQMPVVGATNADFNHQSFWFYPWGRSITHKGVDIFARRNTEIKSATRGLVVYAGQNDMGGNIVVVLGPKWRFHYYAHLEDTKAKRFSVVNRQSIIGTVGDSGNAKGKPTHLHYTIATFVPRIWLLDDSPQRWKKLFYVNPIPYITQ